jgi:signal transduction histidine kinase
MHRIEERLELARAQDARVEAEAANRMNDAFLATVSNELRRPLTAILGWARMLREGQTDDSARGLEVIKRNAKVQLRLIEELLDSSRAAHVLGVATRCSWSRSRGFSSIVSECGGFLTSACNGRAFAGTFVLQTSRLPRVVGEQS